MHRNRTRNFPFNTDRGEHLPPVEPLLIRHRVWKPAQSFDDAVRGPVGIIGQARTVHDRDEADVHAPNVQVFAERGDTMDAFDGEGFFG